MNTIACYICGSTDHELITGNVRFDKKADVYRCRKCGLVFLDQNSFTYPKDFYEGQYHQTYLTHVEPDAFNPKAYYQKMLKTTAIWADRFKADMKGGETVLDLGCSTGHFMELIKDKAGAVYGHDLNKAEVEFCRNELKLDVASDPLETRFKEGMFDYITMIFVLEHISDPVGFLRHIKRFLKPDGKMVILIPNAMDPLMNLYDIPPFRSFYYCIEHLFYYTPKSLQAVFDKAGLAGSVETLQEYPITNHLRWAYRQGPSNVLAAREGTPDVQMAKDVPLDQWAGLWDDINVRYQQFLAANGYGDRIWAVVGKGK